MTCGVYHIIDKSTGRRYIGSSINIEARWYRHRSQARCGKHHSRHFQRAWDAHGESNFFFLVAEICDPNKRVEIESKHLSSYVELNLHLNGRKTADVSGTRLGAKISEETKKKMSDSQKGKPRTHKKRDWSPEQREAVRQFMIEQHRLRKLAAKNKHSKAA